MKLTIILLTAAFLQVSAKSNSQQVTYSGREVPLEKVFIELEKQTEYAFLYSSKVLTGASPVTIKARNMSLLEFLEILFRSQPLKFSIESKTINVTFKSKEVESAERRLTIADFFPVKGVVTGPDGKLLAGINVSVKGTRTGTVTDSEGVFSMNASIGNVLIFTGIGFERKEITLTENAVLAVTMKLKLNDLDTSVVTVSTGYQKIPKERATGSFVHVDNELFNRTVSTDILSRLRDVVPGLVFNRDAAADANSISIRGQNTINANDQPLIVLDNFPYEGDLQSINPNDIAEISVLKDAAAASIWGARAGNGVIVIITKKGRLTQPAQISFNSNVTFGGKPDLYYIPTMSSVDYIETEKRLFSEKYYSVTEGSVDKKPLTPVVELLIKKRDNPLLSAQIDAEIEALKLLDVRTDYNKYLMQNSINQQYAFNIKGGGAQSRYFVSAGYDKNLPNLKGNKTERITLNANNSFSLINNKLEITTGVFLAQNRLQTNNPGIGSLGLSGRSLYPYGQLADPNGNALPIARNYSSNYIDEVRKSGVGLLDWAYRPLQELEAVNNNSKNFDYLINAGITYTIVSSLKAEVLYQYGMTKTEGNILNSVNSYYARDLINNITRVNLDGSLFRPIPLGGILDMSNGNSIRNNIRAQLLYNKTFTRKHEVNALVGAEARDMNTVNAGYRLYGYDEEHSVSKSVDYVNPYTSFVNALSVNNYIYNRDYREEYSDRFLSYYANMSYSFDQTITLSGSARLDRSNLFGVNANQKGVPLWSAGSSWELSKEKFYNISWLPYVRFRATYGYSGNIDKSLSAYTTAYYHSGNDIVIRQPYANIINPPNPELRWERISTLNFGIDFRLKNNSVNGSIEYYAKKGIDIIGDSPYPYYTGINSFRGNTANIKGNGLELSLNVKNIDKALKWTTAYLFSYAGDKVTDYKVKQTVSSYLQFLSMPLEGKPLYAIYSYKWAGLDPSNGNPQGYLADKTVSSDYASIVSQTSPENIVFSGRARPVMFGAIRNSIGWKNISLSINVSYRLGYYFRRTSIRYNDNYGLGGHGDYNLRWSKPGDDKITSIPSMPSVSNAYRDNFYGSSEVLVEKGDNIRLQDINLSYTLAKSRMRRLPVNSIQLYLYANNLGILWKAGKSNIDPDYQYASIPKTISAGIKVEF